MSVFEIKDVSYSYDKSKRILTAVNAVFETGKMYAILGVSGSGKTTLLSLLGGLDVPQKGEILFDGVDISEHTLEYHRCNHVSLIFQSYNLIDYMTPVENVKLTAKQDALLVLKQLGLTEDEAKRNVMKLSGGQQQRVAIARTLASDTPIILADEPTGNLDEDTAAEITEVLKNCAKRPHIDEKGYVLYYTSQYSFNAKYIPAIENIAEEKSIQFKSVHLQIGGRTKRSNAYYYLCIIFRW